MTTGLQDVSLQEGNSATLTVAATSDAGGPLTYAWAKDGDGIDDAAASSYTINAVTLSDAGRYVVTVSDQNDSKESSATVTVRAAALLWVPRFVLLSAVGVAVAFGLALLPIWITASSFLGDNPKLADVIALQLVVLGTVALLAGFYLAFLELRGRARTAEELLRRPARVTSSGKTFGVTKDVADAVPAVLKEFGKLQASAALFVVAVALLGGATAIAWQSLSDGSPTEPAQTQTETTG